MIAVNGSAPICPSSVLAHRFDDEIRDSAIDPVRADEYHLVDIVTAESYGGFHIARGRSGRCSRGGLFAGQIFHGNARVEHHDPEGLAAGAS